MKTSLPCSYLGGTEKCEKSFQVAQDLLKKKKKNSSSIWATEIGQWSWQFLDGWVKVWQLITVVSLSLSAINSCLSTDYTILDVLMRVPLKTAKCLYGFMKHTANPNLGLGFTISFLYVWSDDLYRGKSVHS